MSEDPYIKLIPREPGLFTERRISVKEKASIGRAVGKVKPMPNNGIFDSKVLSRAHAEVWFEDGKFLIKDVKSSNGTFLNSLRLSETSQESKNFDIKNGDIIQFGVDVLENNKVAHKCIIATIVACNPADPDSVASAAAAENNALAVLGGSANVVDDDAPIVSSGGTGPSSASSTGNTASYMAALSALGVGGSSSSFGGGNSSSSGGGAGAASNPPAAAGALAQSGSESSKLDALNRSQTIMLDGSVSSSAPGAPGSAPSSGPSSKSNSIVAELPAALEAAGNDPAAIAAALTATTMGSMNAATAAAVAAAVAAAQAPKPGIIHVRDDAIAKLTTQLVTAHSNQVALEQKLQQLESLVVSLEEAANQEYETYFEEERLIARIHSLENQLAFYQSKLSHMLQAIEQDVSDSAVTQKIAELMSSLVKVEEDRHMFERNAKETIRRALEEKDDKARQCDMLMKMAATHNATFEALNAELKEAKSKAQLTLLENDRLKITVEQNEQQMASLKTEVEELRLTNAGVSDLKRKLSEQSEQLEKAEKFRQEFMTMREQWVTQDEKRQDEILSLRKNVTEITSDRDILKQQVSSLKVTLATALQPSTEAEGLKAKSAELEKQLSAKAAEVEELGKKSAALQSEVDALKAAVGAFEEKLAKAEEERKELETTNKAISELSAQLKTVKEDAAALSEATEQNSELVKRCDKLVQEMNSLRGERDKLATELHALENDKSHEAAKLRDEIARKEAELEKLHQHSETTAQELAVARGVLEKKEASTREELASLGNRLNSISKERDELSDKLGELRKTINKNSQPLILTSASVILLAALVAWRQMAN